MKLYLLQCGIIQSWKHLFTMGRGVNQPFAVPVPFFDVFGDGSVQIVFTPGYTPGHQSLLLHLEKWGPTLLTGDSVYTNEILDEDVLPGLVYSPADAVASIRKTRELRQLHGVRIITGHDPSAWAGYAKAPAYYE